MVSVTIDQGIKYIVGCLPVMIVGWYSAIKQARFTGGYANDG